MTANELAAVIISLRASRGWSQTDLATRAGVSRNCIALIESRNDRANSTLETLEAIFGALALELEIGFRGAKKKVTRRDNA